MTTRTQTSSGPFTRLSLIGKGSQSQSPAPRTRRVPTDDDYIPYNGPYEEPPRRRQDRNRDSWGDPLYDEDGGDMVQELHERYGSNGQSTYPWHDEDEERKSRPRARTHSGVSGRTISSGTVDPHRGSVGLLRKPSQRANAVTPPVPSYINLDAAGGVGESPAPPRRASREIPQPKRGSLASIFTFGQTSKKLPLSPAKIALPNSPPPRVTSPLGKTHYTRALDAYPQRPRSNSSIYSTSSDLHRSKSLAGSVHTSHATDEGDMYHSYYNYTPAVDQFGQLGNPDTASLPPHPYAYNSAPIRDTYQPPQTAPLVTSPKLKFTNPPHRVAFPEQEAVVLATPPTRSLKSFASSPDLRSQNRKQALLSPPKGKDRWLSAETWCDAIMFPRPRLKVEDAQLLLRGASGRIVSPPGSPVYRGFPGQQNPDRPQGVASRVLAHSRSMVSLNNAEAGPSKFRNEPPAAQSRGMHFEMPHAPVLPPLIIHPSQADDRPPRPKSFAWDDLALPSPVPSLARVLEEGQILEHQRKKWQMQATGSFQNTRARSLSRSRSQAATARNGGKAGGQSSIDFLAARSLLGNQNVVPVHPARVRVRTNSQTQSGTNTNGTTTFNTRTSHSHSNSLVKTISKTSLSHSNGHSNQGHMRQDSWSRTAIKKAAALCYVDGVLSPAQEKPDGMEAALRGDETKVIRLEDPALMHVESAGVISAFSRLGPSPTPSALSDPRVGIALSTPPPNEGSAADHEIHLPSHPYAQGGMYAYTAPAPAPEPPRGADYAGPHPAVAIVNNAEPHNFSARHRLPPQASRTYHPYAASSSVRDSYQIVPQHRADSDVPPASKMWAQVSPGVVREILPGEILYSPFMSERSTTPDAEKEVLRNRKSTMTILDTVGLGETLAYAVEEENSRDSGLGTSEEQEHAKAIEEEEAAAAAALEGHHPYRIHRKPVQYDVSRPPYAPKKSRVSSNNDTNHSSSPLDPLMRDRAFGLTPPPLPHHPSSGSSSSPAQDSEASSPPRSPPPIGSVDDLDDFRDLFFRPNLTEEAMSNLSRPGSTRYTSITWDPSARSQRTRTGSGLTSLARQLSQEFSELRAIRHRTGSADSESSISRFSAFPRASELQFVLSESIMNRATEDGAATDGPEESLMAFHASSHLPEDVESSRASSPTDGPGDEDDHENFRVGSIESVATPPATTSDHRNSYMGQMAFVPEQEPKTAPRTISATLQPPASATRSSYMTESTLSRMSNLSDFPVPPPHQHMTPAHMSLLTSYFNESIAADDRSTLHGPPKEADSRPRVGERF